MSAHLRPLGLLAALAIAGCGTQGTLYSKPLAPLPLVATRGALVQVVPQTRRAVILTPPDRTPRTVVLSPGARVAVPVPNSDLLAVLAGTPKAPKLDLVDTSTFERTSFDAPGFFDAITFSDDGRFGVLVYSAGVAGPLTARNLNEVGLLGVQSGSLTRLQLDTESLAPRSVLFGPAEPNRRLVAVTLERGVTVFDALHPEVAPRRISIRPQGSSVETAVVQTVFSRDARWLFLRATNLNDVIAVELGPEVGQPVSASINFVSGGTGLSDIAAAPQGLEDFVVAVYSTSQDAWLLEAHGIQDTVRRLPLSKGYNHVAALTGSRVLLYADGGREVAAWDVADGRSGLISLDGAYSTPTVVATLDKALFPQASTTGASSGPALSTVTVDDDVNRLRLHLQGVQLAFPITASMVDVPTSRLFFSVSGNTALVTMDLRSLQLAEVTLDAAPHRLLFIKDGDWLAADTGNPAGDVTVVPAGTTERAGALRYAGFTLSDDLDRPGDAP